jgi:hypothetical protein
MSAIKLTIRKRDGMQSNIAATYTIEIAVYIKRDRVYKIPARLYYITGLLDFQRAYKNIIWC